MASIDLVFPQQRRITKRFNTWRVAHGEGSSSLQLWWLRMDLHQGSSQPGLVEQGWYSDDDQPWSKVPSSSSTFLLKYWEWTVSEDSSRLPTWYAWLWVINKQITSGNVCLVGSQKHRLLLITQGRGRRKCQHWEWGLIIVRVEDSSSS